MKFSPPSADPDLLGSVETYKYPGISSSVSLRSSSSSEKLYRSFCDLCRDSRCFTTCVCVFFGIGLFPFPLVLLPPVLMGSWKISVHPLHSLLRVTLVSSSRSCPLCSVHTLHVRNFTALLTVYHHPRSPGPNHSTSSFHQSLGMRMMSLSLCSVAVIRSSLMSSKVCARC